MGECAIYFASFMFQSSDDHHRNEKTKKNKTNDYDSKETVHLTVSKSKDKLPKQMMYLLIETKSLNFPLRPDLFKVLVKIFRTFFEIFEPVLIPLANFILSRSQTFFHLKLNKIQSYALAKFYCGRLKANVLTMCSFPYD